MKYSLIGQRFNRWTILSYSQNPRNASCQCDCGTIKILDVSSVKRGKSKSCGCYRKEVLQRERTTHGHSLEDGSPEYIVWLAMKGRCLNPNNSRYERYAKRGISICQEWLDSFEAFYADMGPRPLRMTIERLDNNGNYEPGNCVWANYATQSKNRSNSLWVTFEGRNMTLKELADEKGKDYKSLHHFYRMKRLSLAHALEKAGLRKD